uniref:SMC2 n=1 Tax=Brachionus calyciflorus TaxID=104777 RepID=M4SIS3_9BILA|nr:SMC2 [Brachionus calyciflorus]
MYIKEISIDGFKSYAQQTVVSQFDPHFNAITGLNGSGKSNILDSICFVLGISNLTQVRATHLQELIYKGGNAGITKATVSITFDNMDKNQSPPGYQDYEEITITRQISVGNKHKYLINGQNATAQRVSDLFCSVQLNVNNPNFLIMQGKITKVLNMKPVEILSMIEEAAGTKTYDIKKANSLRYPQLNFEYKDPEPNFDRSKVKGLVCSLFKIKDPKFSTAIETAAGGKLFNLVVDTDKTGKLILQKGELKRKVTIAPLNQIRGYPPSERVVKAAKDLVGYDNVHTALSLIEYDPVYKTLMEYVFGSKLVCFNLDTAKTVAFNPQVMTTTITLDGDTFDPEGTLSGGSRGERANFLAKISELKQDSEEVRLKQEEMSKLDIDLRKEKEISIQYSRIKNDFDIQVNQLNLAKINLEQTSHHQKMEKINSLTEEIKTQQEESENSTKELEALKVKLIDLEERVKNQGKNDIEKEKAKAQKKIDDAKKNFENKQQSSSQIQHDHKTITLEIGVLRKEINGFNEELEKLEQNVNNLNEEIESKTSQINEMKTQEDKLLGLYNERKEIIREKHRVLDSKSKEIDRLVKEKNSIELKIKELDHRKSDLKNQLKNSEERLEMLVRENPWIEDDRKLFGQTNSIYDFARQNMKEVNHRLHELKNRKDKLSKQVDMRAMGMLAKKEEEYEELTKKRQIVLNDRATLETTIEDLEKIKEVLIKAFESINKDLGNIFKTLLPGAFAKLEWVNRNSLLDGVEFKVAFGDVWKESLTELSGGQRSLVALSLILSLLLYNPAPLYILDEVDAALDTSHTQNIGLMIKKYFKASQFVIVSLKDGMFNNANVLFKTKLVDGVSTIQRYEQKKKANNSERERDTYAALNDQTNLRR